jgi:hypothetical protein
MLKRELEVVFPTSLLAILRASPHQQSDPGFSRTALHPHEASVLEQVGIGGEFKNRA